MSLPYFKSVARRVALLIVLGLTGCASLAPDIGDMTRAYSESIEIHERNQILKNLLRSGDGLPMSFQTVPTIVGTGQLEGSATLSGKLLGGFINNSSASNVLRSARTFNFTLASLDNEKFISAFLRDTPLETINVFSSGDFHRQMLFTLVLHNIAINPGRVDAQVIENNVLNRDDFKRFQSQLVNLTEAGLRTESVRARVQIGPDLSREEILRHYFDSRLSQDTSFQVRRLTGPQGATTYRVVRIRSYARFCLSTVHYQALSGLSLPQSLDCLPAGSFFLPDEPIDGDPAADLLNFSIRSARDVYRFVGQIALAPMREDGWRPTIRLKQPYSGLEAGEHPLIVVRKGQPAVGERVLAVAEHMDSTYYVPYENSGLSRRVFEYLSLLLSTSMVKDAIPASPGILIR